jgi:hypothetical protein
MSESLPEEYLASQKGWITVAFDQNIWSPCPPAFPSGMDRESWAEEYSKVWWKSSHVKHREHDERLLAQTLSFIHANTYGTLPLPSGSHPSSRSPDGAAARVFRHLAGAG